jgi:hypothetical protein
MNYFFGRILMIVGYPFEGLRCIAAYDSHAERMPVQITASVGDNSTEEDFME